MSDGGAHTKFFTGGAWTTDFLRWLVRDEAQGHARGGPLPHVGAGRPRGRLPDRGVLREGAAADVVVYDMEELDIEPALGRRGRPRPARRRVAPGAAGAGYKDIIVNGETTFADGECTGATPGRLLRHGRGLARAPVPRAGGRTVQRVERRGRAGGDGGRQLAGRSVGVDEHVGAARPSGSCRR